jgi:hypothetical protein
MSTRYSSYNSLADEMLNLDRLDNDWALSQTLISITRGGVAGLSAVLNPHTRADVVAAQMRGVDLELRCERAWRPEFR